MILTQVISFFFFFAWCVKLRIVFCCSQFLAAHRKTRYRHASRQKAICVRSLCRDCGSVLNEFLSSFQSILYIRLGLMHISLPLFFSFLHSFMVAALFTRRRRPLRDAPRDALVYGRAPAHGPRFIHSAPPSVYLPFPWAAKRQGFFCWFKLFLLLLT